MAYDRVRMSEYKRRIHGLCILWVTTLKGQEGV